MAPFGGRFRDALPHCRAGYVSTAADAGSVAVAMVGGSCEGVWLDGRRLATTADPRQVRLAGLYLAWLEWPGGDARVARITVADRATGTAARALHRAPAGSCSPASTDIWSVRVASL